MTHWRRRVKGWVCFVCSSVKIAGAQAAAAAAEPAAAELLLHQLTLLLSCCCLAAAAAELFELGHRKPIHPTLWGEGCKKEPLPQAPHADTPLTPLIQKALPLRKVFDSLNMPGCFLKQCLIQRLEYLLCFVIQTAPPGKVLIAY